LDTKENRNSVPSKHTQNIDACNLPLVTRPP